MPTYFCRVPSNLLTHEQKVRIANAITARHSEATGAPTFFVQVIIDEDKGGDRYVGGTAAGDHIWINGDLREGRTSAQIEGLMLNIMQDVADISGIRREDIWIYINTLYCDHMVEFGKVLPQAGREAEWFASLPEELKQRLNDLDITHKEFML